MSGAINVPIDTTLFYEQYDAHTIIQSPEKWNQFVDPLFRK